MVAVGDWFLEAFRADYLLRTAIDTVSTIFWIGGIGAAGQLQTLTSQLENCHSNDGLFPETGAIIAFAVFEVLLFATAAYHAQEDLPVSEDQASKCENGCAPDAATGTLGPMSHLRPGDFSEYITVNVGDGDTQRAFQVAKAPICRRSDYIKTAVSNTWTARLGIPSKAKVVDLSDEDPDVFQTYVQCIMENNIAVPNLDIEHPGREQSDCVFVSLFALYVLVDKLGDPESMNLVIDAVARYSLASHRVPDCEAVTYAFEYSVKTSPLRRLIADIFHLGYDQEGTKENRLDGMPNEFLVQYAQTNPDIQTVAPGSQRYHQPVEKQRAFREVLRGGPKYSSSPTSPEAMRPSQESRFGLFKGKLTERK